MRRTVSSHEAATEFAVVLAEACSPGEGTRLDHLLQSLNAATDASAAMLTVRSGDDRPARVLAATGYSTEIVDAVTSVEFARTDPSYRVITTDRDRPIRSWWDLEFDYAGSEIARDLLIPGGFRGGLSLRLDTAAGRHVGELHLSTEDRRLPTPEAMRLLRRTATVLAGICDGPSPVRLAGNLHAPTEHAFSVQYDGTVVPHRLPPGSEADTVAMMTMVAGLAATLRIGAPVPYCAHRWLAPDGAWRTVSAYATKTGAFVTVSREQVPYDLTKRELDVVSWLGTGLSNYSIARRLGLSERTVAHHVERTLRKLGVTSRAEASAVAERHGLTVIDASGQRPTRHGG